MVRAWSDRAIALLLALGAGLAGGPVAAQSPQPSPAAPTAPVKGSAGGGSAVSAPAPASPPASGSPASESPAKAGPSPQGKPASATSPAKPSAQQAPQTPASDDPLKPPALAPEPVRIWQPEGLLEPAQRSQPLPRRNLGVGPTTRPEGSPRGSAGTEVRPGGDPRALPPGLGPTGAMLRGPMPPGAMPPGVFRRGPLPPGALPPGVLPPGAMPPGAMPPGAMPPGAMPPGMVRPQPPGSPSGEQRAANQSWSPWTSLGAGLLLAAGVTMAVTFARRQRQLEDSPLERQDDEQQPRG